MPEVASNAREEDTVASEIIDESDSAFLGADAYLYADDVAMARTSILITKIKWRTSSTKVPILEEI